MKILVRLDISKKIGTGHFRRMLNLANFMSNHDFVFIINSDNELNQIFKEKNIVFIDNENEFLKILKTYEYDVIILDLLHYNNAFMKNIKNIVKKHIVSFHEYKDFSEHSDLRINYNLFDGYNQEKKNNDLFGLEYIIFSDEIEKYKNIEKDDYIFVSFGGSDPSNLTQNFINDVALKKPDINFKIHIGSFNKINSIKSKNIEYLYNPKDIFIYMASATLAITAGGNIMYELIYFKIPSIVIAHNEHQKEFALNADKLGLVEYLGLSSEYKLNLLVDKIELLKNKSLSCFENIIDNNGKRKIAREIERLVS